VGRGFAVLQEGHFLPQYFENAELKNPKYYEYSATIGGKTYDLLGASGTFSKDSLDDGTRYLLEAIIQADLGTKILDLGAGSGPIGLILAEADPSRHVVLSDVNLRALDTARMNAERLGVQDRVEIVYSDVYSNLDSTFDTIVSNPPIRAGKSVTYAMYDGAPSHLNEGGSLIIVIRKQQGASSAEAHISSLFNRTEVIASKKGYRVIKATK
jgi:16S rRNA (guanine1207-N2)-methyltransferase